jgi:FAD/FMN-containing dehydrogenase
MKAGTSWGRWPRHEHRIRQIGSRFDALPLEASMLAYGNGRSYGDVCLNDRGVLLLTRGLDRFIAFDPATGVIECEAGVLLQAIIDLILPHGWFLPSTPGTAMVTVGGAIANDVHGKNHHRVGSFGHHLLELELQRSDGSVFTCSPTEKREWFVATLGGLGLTGFILRAKLQLRRVPGPWFRGDSIRFGNIEEFFALAHASDRDYEYTVSWIDCVAKGKRLGRGVFMRGNHTPLHSATPKDRRVRVPFTLPISAVNGLSLRPFNALYYRRPSASRQNTVWHYRSFLYPLDSVLEWNRIYGPQGFFQYQCVVPNAIAPDALRAMLERIGKSGVGSFLAVLKCFGDIPSLGMLSFPRPGVTLALDFPNRGAPTLQLLEALDQITCQAGGAVYPAKDARMSARSFRQYFPAWESFMKYVDPKFTSSFWRRVAGGNV